MVNMGMYSRMEGLLIKTNGDIAGRIYKRNLKDKNWETSFQDSIKEDLSGDFGVFCYVKKLIEFNVTELVMLINNDEKLIKNLPDNVIGTKLYIGKLPDSENYIAGNILILKYNILGEVIGLTELEIKFVKAVIKKVKGKV